MQEFLERILTANLVFTTLIFYVTARIYLLPRMQEHQWWKPHKISDCCSDYIAIYIGR
jgi:hypothetical protein